MQRTSASGSRGSKRTSLRSVSVEVIGPLVRKESDGMRLQLAMLIERSIESRLALVVLPHVKFAIRCATDLKVARSAVFAEAERLAILQHQRQSGATVFHILLITNTEQTFLLPNQPHSTHTHNTNTQCETGFTQPAAAQSMGCD